MKFAALIIALAACLSNGFGQCFSMAETCSKSIGNAYLLDPSFFNAEISPSDVASFRAIWLKEQTYRLAVCSSDNLSAEWMVYDENGTLLFSNTEFESATQWDFLCEHTMHVQLVVRLNKNAVQPACVAIVHGFKK
ncbi:MAG: hypothetical protein ACK478_06715 [Flavobacteriales bacterium]|jgi:hypothetical protein